MIYIRYKCDKCNREIEAELEPLRPTLDKCNITFRCEGKLKKIGEKKLRSELVPLPQAGLDSWRQRGTTVTDLSTTTDVWVTALSLANTLTFAIKQSAHASGDVTLRLNMLSNSARPFTEYTYSAAPQTKIITGLDINSKNLRFTSDDEVYVYVNGVKQYSLDQDDTSYSVTLGTYTKDFSSYSIKFTSALTDSSTVKVVVYGVLTNVTYDIVGKHESTSSSWGNVETVKIADEIYDVYNANCYELPVNFYFSVNSLFDSSSSNIALTNAVLLLSVRPFTQLDRNYGHVVLLSNADLRLNKLVSDNISDVRINSSLISNLYPPITVVRYDGSLSDTISSSTGFDIAQDIVKSKLVIGPIV